MRLLGGVSNMNVLVAGNGSYILGPCGHDLHGATVPIPGAFLCELVSASQPASAKRNTYNVVKIKDNKNGHYYGKHIQLVFLGGFRFTLNHHLIPWHMVILDGQYGTLNTGNFWVKF